MSDLSYTSGVTGTVHDLTDGISWGGALQLRARPWEYTLGYRNLYSRTRRAHEADINMTVVDVSALDSLMRDSDADITADSPGVLTALTESGEAWTQRAFITKSSPQSHHRAADANIDLTVVLLDGVWRRNVYTTFRQSTQASTSYLNYPYDYPYDYMAMPKAGVAVNNEHTPSPIRLRIYGPCSNPVIRIAGNRYQVDVDVPSGSRLEVDGADDPKTIRLIDQSGTVTNVFDKGVRGDGLDKGSYVFQPIPPGSHEVNWQGFDFELGVVAERSEPPWIS